MLAMLACPSTALVSSFGLLQMFAPAQPEGSGKNGKVTVLVSTITQAQKWGAPKGFRVGWRSQWYVENFFGK